MAKLATVLLLTASPWTSWPAAQAHSVASVGVNSRVSSIPRVSPAGSKSNLTARELTYARAIARYWASKSGGRLTSATVTASAGKEFEHNVGDVCASGRLLHIRLIGSFNLGHSSKAVFQDGGTSGSTTVDDGPVTYVQITADGKTGRACLVGVGTRPIEPAPKSIALRIN